LKCKMGNSTSSGKGQPQRLVSSNSNSDVFGSQCVVPSTPSAVEEDNSWILECMVEFVKSPECSIFVEGFIDENCLVFDTDNPDPDMLLEFEQIHVRYKEVIESLLVTRLSKLGLTVSQFHEAMAKAKKAQLMDVHILQYIIGIEDFNVFQNIMIHRNIQLEKEAIKYLEEHQALCTAADPNSKGMTEEEQLVWAMRESLDIQQPTTPMTAETDDHTQDGLRELMHQKEEVIPSTSASLLDKESTAKVMKSFEVNSTPKFEEFDVGPAEKEEVKEEVNPFELFANINLSKSKRVSLKPLNVAKRANVKKDNVQFMPIQSEEDLPTLTAETIQKIKMKQSSKRSAIMERKRMILKLRKQRRTKKMQSIEDIQDWNENLERLHSYGSTSASVPASLPPLHKSLLANIQQRESIPEESPSAQ